MPFPDAFPGLAKPGPPALGSRIIAGALVIVLAALTLVSAVGPPRSVVAANCEGSSTGLVPLDDIARVAHKGQRGGLYPNERNTPPTGHLDQAMTGAAAIQPLDSTGRPDPGGKVVLLSVGMSNTTQEFSSFVRDAAGDAQLHPRLQLVDGAQGGQTAADIREPGARFWQVVDQRLGAADASAEQVQVIWLKEANRQPGADGNPDTLPAARQLSDDLEGVLKVAMDRFPNLQLVYLASRIYAGYASSTLNPEPFAYESGLAVRWLIERQIEGDEGLDPSAGAPVLLWGPYLWADGLTPRGDGLTWACSDFVEDGTHPSNSGRGKVAGLLMAFFKTDPTSREWFMADPDATPAPTPSPDPASTATPQGRPTQQTGGLRSYRVIESPSDDRMWVSATHAQTQRRMDPYPVGRLTWLCGPVRRAEGAEWGFEYLPDNVRVLPEPPDNATQTTIRDLAANPAAATGPQCIRIGGVDEVLDGPPPAAVSTATAAPGEPTATPRRTPEPVGTPERPPEAIFLPLLLSKVGVASEAPAPTEGTPRTQPPTPKPEPTTAPSPTVEPVPPVDLGEVRVVSETCAGFRSKLPGTFCLELEVSCPSLDPIPVRLAITDVPTDVLSRGTIVFGTGGGGQGFYEGFGEFAVSAMQDLNAAGYRIVQRGWGRAWESAESGMFAASCRYATLITWLHAQEDRPEGAFCATGNSGGSAEISYALARWGRAAILDFALPSGGPPMGRLDLGCAGADDFAWMAECPGLRPEGSTCQSIACGYAESSARTIDSAYAGTPCADKLLPPLLADSIVSPDALSSYPDTKLRFVFGDRDCGSAVAQGMLYYHAITSDKSLVVAADTPHAVPSSAIGARAIRDAMMQDCTVPAGGDG